MMHMLHRRVGRQKGAPGPCSLGIPVLVVTLLLASAVLAQGTPKAVAEIFTVRSRPAQEVAEALGVALPDLKPNIRVAPQNTLVVRGLSPELRAVLQQLIDRFDVPEVTFEVRARLILASSDYKQRQPVPEELRDLADLLGSVFTFKKYELLDEVLLRAQAGVATTAVLDGGRYQLRFTARHQPAGEGPSAEAGFFAFDTFVLARRDVVRIEEERRGKQTVRKEIMGYRPVLETSFRAGSEKPVVVGASRMGEGGRALIVVLKVTPVGG